jgi:hypothetical protein
MSVFSICICEFPCANLQRLELSLSIPENDYDDTLAYVNCPIRREDIFGFATLMARAKNLEHLLLRLASILHPGHTWIGGIEPDTSQLRMDVFHSIATKSYMDGTPIALETDGMLLPKLKSIDLQYQQIRLSQLLKFCSERKHTLERVRLTTSWTLPKHWSTGMLQAKSKQR